MLKWLKIFNKYDLYTKSDNIGVNEKIINYYDELINKYIKDGSLWL